MDCTHSSEALTAWVLGELDESERADLLDHVASCEKCLAEASALRDLVAELGTTLADDAPKPHDGFRDEVLAEARRISMGTRRRLPVKAKSGRRRAVTSVRELEPVTARRGIRPFLVYYAALPAAAAALFAFLLFGIIDATTAPYDTTVRVQIVEAGGGAELITQGASARPATGDVVAAGATIQTGINGQIGIRYPDGTLARIEPDSDVTLDRDRISKFMTLSLGRVSVTTSSASSGGPMVIATPLCELKAGGSAKFVLVAEPDGNRLEVQSGFVLLTRTDDGSSVEASAGHFVEVSEGVALVARHMDPVSPTGVASRSRPEQPQPRDEAADAASVETPPQSLIEKAEAVAADEPERPAEELLAHAKVPTGRLAGYVDTADGEVELTQAHNGTRLSASAGTPLFAGDTLRTRLSRARVYFESGSILHVNRFTRLKLTLRDGTLGVAVVVGEVFAEVDHKDAGFFVDTPHGTTTDLGTRFDVSVKPITGTNVVVVEGAVETSTSAGSALLAANQEVRLSSKSSPPGQVRVVTNIAARLAWTDDIPGSARRFARKKLTDGLVGVWRFDDAAGWMARNAVNPQLVGALRGATWTTGCVGPALSFGGDDYVVVENTAPLDGISGELTIAAWVRIARLGYDMKIAGRQDRTGPGYKLEVFNSKVGFDVFEERGRTHLLRPLAGGTILRPGVWYHVAGVLSASQGVMRTYVNGQLDREKRVTLTAGVPKSAFFVGREPYADALYWNGKIDELCLFGRALNDAEIKQLAAWPGLR